MTIGTNRGLQAGGRRADISPFAAASFFPFSFIRYRMAPESQPTRRYFFARPTYCYGGARR
ncbi:hypothetical protein [Paenibacillus sp. GYB003]|uniref:hypothetical protein n=1 Tax=Paenibacillus sp. GYB003 TaxID=2994392 RepID=UPI002F963A5D